MWKGVTVVLALAACDGASGVDGKDGSDGKSAAGGATFHQVIVDDGEALTVEPRADNWQVTRCDDYNGVDRCVDITADYAIYDGALCLSQEFENSGECLMRGGGYTRVVSWVE